MVGRRYRDVLEASNVTRRLTEISSDFSSQLHTIRDIVSQPKAHHAQSLMKRQPVYRFALLNRILPTVSSFGLQIFVEFLKNFKFSKLEKILKIKESFLSSAILTTRYPKCFRYCWWRIFIAQFRLSPSISRRRCRWLYMRFRRN